MSLQVNNLIGFGVRAGGALGPLSINYQSNHYSSSNFSTTSGSTFNATGIGSNSSEANRTIILHVSAPTNSGSNVYLYNALSVTLGGDADIGCISRLGQHLGAPPRSGDGFFMFDGGGLGTSEDIVFTALNGLTIDDVAFTVYEVINGSLFSRFSHKDVSTGSVDLVTVTTDCLAAHQLLVGGLILQSGSTRTESGFTSDYEAVQRSNVAGTRDWWLFSGLNTSPSANQVCSMDYNSDSRATICALVIANGANAGFDTGNIADPPGS